MPERSQLRRGDRVMYFGSRTPDATPGTVVNTKTLMGVPSIVVELDAGWRVTTVESELSLIRRGSRSSGT